MSSDAQLALSLEAIVEIPLAENEPVADRFRRFHEANPHVYRELVRLARALKVRGFGHAGMKSLFEQLRWQWAWRTKGQERYKLNNNYTAHYARLIMKREPDLEGFFRTRERSTQ
jgi:hypothetical protein